MEPSSSVPGSGIEDVPDNNIVVDTYGMATVFGSKAWRWGP